MGKRAPSELGTAALSPELAGGAGHTFEDMVAAGYLVALLRTCEAPGIPDRSVIRVALQQRSFGDPLDDLVVDFESATGDPARLSLQLKQSLVISRAAGNSDFREVIRDSLRTMRGAHFCRGSDRFGAATRTIAHSAARTLETLCEIARASKTVAHFEARFAAGGNASLDQARTKNSIAALIAEIEQAPCTSADLHCFLSHFVLLRFDYLHEGAIAPPAMISGVREALAPEAADLAPLVWNRLCQEAREGAGRSEEFLRPNLVRTISRLARLAGVPWLRTDIARLVAVARSAVRDIEDEVGSARLAREALTKALAAEIEKRRFVQIRGLPGSGKSVLMRRQLELDLAQGPALFLKADRLEGCDWATYAKAIGLEHSEIVPLLVEIGALGSRTLYIDGIDRVARGQRAIILDLVHEILTAPELEDWRMVATLRDNGIEPLRNWLPRALIAPGCMGSVEVGSLEGGEVEELAKSEPGLRAMLYGNTNVRELVRRPFFAKILLQAASGLEDGQEPGSEVDLIDGWWRRGGYDLDGTAARLRQRALLDLGIIAARELTKPIAVGALAPETIALLDDLRSDGIVHDVRHGHTVRFAHDIFFEWAYFQVLVAAGGEWPAVLTAIGEPPLIGRIVELLAQARLETDDWASDLEGLERASMRPQWLRAWLLGPFAAPNFKQVENRLLKVIETNDFRLMRRLLVWFQAEKTTPNPAILSGAAGTSMESDRRIRLADLLGWPADAPTWERLIDLLLRRADKMPADLARDIIAVFEVWQNACSDIRNSLSQAILKQVRAWLGELEEYRASRSGSGDAPASRWSEVSDTDEIEETLRQMLLRAARAEPALVGNYLSKLQAEDTSLDRVFPTLASYAPILAETHPVQLTDLALKHFLMELPDDRLKRLDEEDRQAEQARLERRAKPREYRSHLDELMDSAPDIHIGRDTIAMGEWDRLSVDRDMGHYFPTSPLREPFRALFTLAPDEALRLIRGMSNHAMESWRQLHRLDYRRRARPIPLDLRFPWGTQRFWGGRREYLWARGRRGPQPLSCGYLALDSWAHAELERGVDPDALIQRILAGNDSIAALGVAIPIALTASLVSDTGEALITSQRLWQADIERYVAEASIRSSSSIGFNKGDEAHADAVRALNDMPVRRHELRHLVPLYALGADTDRASRVREVIQAFRNDPPYELEEQRDDPASVADLEEFACTMSEWGDATNYRLIEDASVPGQKLVEHVNPMAQSPKGQESLTRSRQSMSEFSLFLWASKSLENGAFGPEMDIVEARRLAEDFDKPGLLGADAEDDNLSIRRGAVAATAAAVTMLWSEASDDDRHWARDVIRRAYATPEGGPLWSAGAIIDWHQGLFVARALAHEIRATDASEAAEALLQLTAHPLEQVALEALGQLLQLWDAEPLLTWTALALAFSYCQLSEDYSGDASLVDPGYGLDTRLAKAESAIQAIRAREWLEIDGPPPAWEACETDQARPYSRHGWEESGWHPSKALWDSFLAPKILDRVPADALIHDANLRERLLPFVERLVGWTIEKIAPPWNTSGRDLRADRDIFDWCNALPRFVARLAGGLEETITLRLFLDPVCGLDDDACFALLAPFVDIYIRAHVFDADVIAAPTDAILGGALDRMLVARAFKPTRYRAGEIYGHDLPILIESFLFVSVDSAMGARRFANRDWHEVMRILPFVDRLVRNAGWVPSVMSHFLALCERAHEHYPAELLAEQLLAVVGDDPARLGKWQGLTLPARIASVVQKTADRESPMERPLAQKLLRVLDMMVDLGDRRSAALQISDSFRDVRVA